METVSKSKSIVFALVIFFSFSVIGIISEFKPMLVRSAGVRFPNYSEIFEFRAFVIFSLLLFYFGFNVFRKKYGNIEGKWIRGYLNLNFPPKVGALLSVLMVFVTTFLLNSNSILIPNFGAANFNYLWVQPSTEGALIKWVYSIPSLIQGTLFKFFGISATVYYTSTLLLLLTIFQVWLFRLVKLSFPLITLLSICLLNSYFYSLFFDSVENFLFIQLVLLVFSVFYLRQWFKFAALILFVIALTRPTLILFVGSVVLADMLSILVMKGDIAQKLKYFKEKRFGAYICFISLFLCWTFYTLFHGVHWLQLSLRSYQPLEIDGHLITPWDLTFFSHLFWVLPIVMLVWVFSIFNLNFTKDRDRGLFALVIASTLFLFLNTLFYENSVLYYYNFRYLAHPLPIFISVVTCAYLYQGRANKTKLIAILSFLYLAIIEPSALISNLKQYISNNDQSEQKVKLVEVLDQKRVFLAFLTENQVVEISGCKPYSSNLIASNIVNAKKLVLSSSFKLTSKNATQILITCRQTNEGTKIGNIKSANIYVLEDRPPQFFKEAKILNDLSIQKGSIAELLFSNRKHIYSLTDSKATLFRCGRYTTRAIKVMFHRKLFAFDQKNLERISGQISADNKMLFITCANLDKVPDLQLRSIKFYGISEGQELLNIYENLTNS